MTRENISETRAVFFQNTDRTLATCQKKKKKYSKSKIRNERGDVTDTTKIQRLGRLGGSVS